MIETGENVFRQTRRHVVVSPLAALPVKKKPRRERKKVGMGFTAAELAAIREIERERDIPSFDEMVRATRDGR